MLVDSHCHLEFIDFKNDFKEVISRAKTNGVVAMLAICTKLDSLHKTLKIAAGRKNIFCTLGVHPNNVSQEKQFNYIDLCSLTDHPKIIGLGETGLDYHYNYSPKERQKESFISHIKASQETGLPLIVHTRDADQDTVKILKEQYEIKKFKSLIHCFTSTRWLAEQCLKIGSYISISGIVTFKNAKEIQDVVKDIPIDRLLLETDAPYLAPSPHRGKRNEPAFVKHTAEFIANLRGIEFEKLAHKTTDNFYKLFEKAKR